MLCDVHITFESPFSPCHMAPASENGQLLSDLDYSHCDSLFISATSTVQFCLLGVWENHSSTRMKPLDCNCRLTPLVCVALPSCGHNLPNNVSNTKQDRDINFRLRSTCDTAYFKIHFRTYISQMFTCIFTVTAN